MIYLDNGATSFPKPESMINKMYECMKSYCGNPGRSGHKMAMKTGQEIYNTRKELAGLFNIDDASRIVFTLNTTEALNLAIKGILKNGDHVITTSMEHNSVIRPLTEIEKIGVEVSILKNYSDGSFPMDSLNKTIKSNTKLIVCTHASNVTGTIMPIEEIGKIAKEKNILFMVDGAQSVGVLNLDVKAMNIDILAFPGHKGLLGPLGTGGLYVREGIYLKPLKEGGTGTASKDLRQPWEFPEGYEAGTLNAPGIIGLGESIKFVKKVGLNKIREHEEKLVFRMEEGLLNLNDMFKSKRISLYGPWDVHRKTGIVLFSIDGYNCEEIVDRLSREFNIATRGGFHCAGLAHKTIGTYDTGAVRISVGPFNSAKEIDYTINAIRKLW